MKDYEERDRERRIKLRWSSWEAEAGPPPAAGEEK
jgi:hypothetical protein